MNRGTSLAPYLLRNLATTAGGIRADETAVLDAGTEIDTPLNKVKKTSAAVLQPYHADPRFSGSAVENEPRGIGPVGLQPFLYKIREGLPVTRTESSTGP